MPVLDPVHAHSLDSCPQGLDICWDDIAPWTEPRYSRTRVDKAGACYIDPGSSAADRDAARTVINNWRSSHSYPLNTIQVNLRRAANQVDDDPTVAQRIKRLPSIRRKLERIPGMHLLGCKTWGAADHLAHLMHWNSVFLT
jgi:hypothetical protein